MTPWSGTPTFDSETTAKHAFALGQTGTAPPPPTLIPHGVADGVVYDNSNTTPMVTDLTVDGGILEADLTWRNPMQPGWS
jgi:hypothetical protein